MVSQIRLHWVQDRARARAVNDTRPKMDDYVIADVVFTYRKLVGNFDASITGANVFDVEAREPSAISAIGAQIPGDFPMPSHSIIVSASGKF